ncbi:hypothetical protein D051_2706 [Vibrio parahaemolyticus VPCR-2010]|nr:hypothetical protein D051_2706 [Vibrio parahaemolyticus VPCR-2010]
MFLPENGQNLLEVKEKLLHLSDELVKLVEYQIYFFLSVSWIDQT